MRFADILAFALAVLWQQKMRTVLTTLGVLFGTLVLVISLSAGRGVQDTIARQYARYRELRQIDVYSSYEAAAPDLSKEKLLTEGTMSEAKRERLRDEILRRGQRSGERTSGVQLTPDRLRSLAEIDHVQSVVPPLLRSGQVFFRHKAQAMDSCAAPPDHKELRQRVVAGDFLKAWDGRSAVVTEYLLYRLGIVREADVEGVLGQKLRLEYHSHPNRPNLLLYLFGAGAPGASVPEPQLLEKVIKQLPAAFEKLDLSPAEKDALRKLTQPPPSLAKQGGSDSVSEEFTIAGVLRGPRKDAPRGPSQWWTNDVDVVLPVRTAEELLFRLTEVREEGLGHAVVEVDDVENVKEVTRKINTMGLQASSLGEHIEREQLMFLLIFATMTCMAAVALLVAALGITNTMLMSVLERTREVGILKAVGARDRHIQSIFLVEGALIGVAGGLLGLLLSWAASFPGDAWVRSLVADRFKVELQESVFVFPPWLLVGAPLFACVVTTLAAVYPARRAAKVDPIKTLRHE